MDEEQQDQGLKVDFGQIFINRFDNFPAADKQKIQEFADHVSRYGFRRLPGRNKPSTDVPTDDKDFIDKVVYARRHNLWHYHIGIPSYDERNDFGDYTSEYVLHYKHMGAEIVVVDFDFHPPLSLPSIQYLVDDLEEEGTEGLFSSFRC